MQVEVAVAVKTQAEQAGLGSVVMVDMTRIMLALLAWLIRAAVVEAVAVVPEVPV